MSRMIKPAMWAVTLFGEELAHRLMDAIPAAIQAAVSRQMDGHDAVGLTSRHAFGGGWPARYEELVKHLTEIPGTEAVRPAGKSYRIALVNNVAILPIEYAKDLATPYDSPKALRKINRTALELARQYGPEPAHTQLTLEGMELRTDTADTDQQLLRGLRPDGIVIVYYAAHERLGLLDIGWGQISVNDDTATWVASQALHVPTATPIPGLRVLQSAGRTATNNRFDHGDLQSPALAPRTALGTVEPTAAEQLNLRSNDKT